MQGLNIHKMMSKTQARHTNCCLESAPLHRGKTWHNTDLSKFFNLFLAPSHIWVGDVWLLFNLHHGDRGVNLRWEWDVDLVLVAVDAHTHSLLDVGRRNLLVQIYHEFGKLLHVDDVLGVFRVGIDDLGAPGKPRNALIFPQFITGFFQILSLHFTLPLGEAVLTEVSAYLLPSPTWQEAQDRCRSLLSQPTRWPFSWSLLCHSQPFVQRELQSCWFYLRIVAFLQKNYLLEWLRILSLAVSFEKFNISFIQGLELFLLFLVVGFAGTTHVLA